jgi:hypothetical protein
MISRVSPASTRASALEMLLFNSLTDSAPMSSSVATVAT